jgi:hypothetical protein
MDESDVFPDLGAVTPRLMRRIAADFPGRANDVVVRLQQVDPCGQDRERVLAAVVLGANGDEETLCRLIESAMLDWRDVLVNGSLADGDWADTLNHILGRDER